MKKYFCIPLDLRFAFVEFSEPSAVNTALQYNGVIFGGRPLK